MFENQMSPFEFARIHDSCCSKSIHSRQYNSAISEFRAFLLRGSFFRLKMKVLHRQPFLYDLNAIKRGLYIHGSSYAGVKTVRIDSIIGSEGRVSDFDSGFHPMSEAASERWVNIAMAYIARLPLPPVQLIEVGDSYFIRDGHHRVSVARAFGQSAIDAEVISWNAAHPFPWQSEATPEKMYALKQADLSA